MSIFVSSAVAASHSNFLLESNVSLLLNSIVAPLYSRRSARCYHRRRYSLEDSSYRMIDKLCNDLL